MFMCRKRSSYICCDAIFSGFRGTAAPFPYASITQNIYSIAIAKGLDIITTLI